MKRINLILTIILVSPALFSQKKTAPAQNPYDAIDKIIDKKNDSLIQEYNEKFQSLPRSIPLLIQEDTVLLRRLLKESRVYQAIAVFTVIFGVLYFFLPADLIPDDLPLIGYLDDLIVVIFLILCSFWVAEWYRQRLLLQILNRLANESHSN